MKLLALDTATPVTHVCVWAGGAPAALVEDAERPHAAALLPAVERALAEAGIALAELDGFAVSVGPGSFTGLRIGLATVKAFVLGDPRPRVAPVPTLAALAWPHRGGEGGPGVVACLDAQRGELYAAGYRTRAGGLEVGFGEEVVAPEALAARLPAGTRVVGQGVEALAGAPGAERLAIREAGASAVAVAELGARLLAAGRGVTGAALAPRYVRRAEAEARRLGRPLEDPTPGGEPGHLL